MKFKMGVGWYMIQCFISYFTRVQMCHQMFLTNNQEGIFGTSVYCLTILICSVEIKIDGFLKTMG